MANNTPVHHSEAGSSMATDGSTVQQSTAHHPLVLIVDDDPVFLLMLEQFLTGHHYRVVKADCGIDAIRLCQQHQPDAVLLDGDLPDLSGVDICQTLKQLPKGEHTPVIMVTAVNDEAFIDEAFKAGSSDYITKPIHWAVLKNRLSYLLQVNEATKALKVSEARKRAILNATADGIITISESGAVVDMNPAAEHIFDLSIEGNDQGANKANNQGVDQDGNLLQGLQLDSLLPDYASLLAQDVVKTQKSGEKKLDTGTSSLQQMRAIRYNSLHPEGELFPVEVSCSRISYSNPPLYTLTIRDISERLAHEEALTLASSVFNNTSEAIIITDANNRILSVNPAFCKITGFSEEEVAGHSPALLSSGRHPGEFYHEMWQELQAAGSWQGEIWNRRKTGELYPEWLSINTVKHSDTGEVLRYIGLFSDITQRKKYEEDIWYQANYDALTDLPNRTLFSAKLKEAVIRQKQENRPFALMFIDLDRFKEVNDTLGHSFGDLLLLEAAQRLQRVVGNSNLVARLGGDEFTALFDQVSNIKELEQFAEKIVQELRKPFHVNGEELNYISGSVGITLCPADAADMETLLKHADMAMYRAKEAGRNTYRFYTTEMNSHALNRIRMEGELRQAINKQEFVLFYQPSLDLKSQTVVSVEALIRWQHPTQGLLVPDEFIPLAEESGLINDIGMIVIEQACRQLRQWCDSGSGIQRIAVNIASSELEVVDSFFDFFEQTLARYQLSREQIKLEITEHLLMNKNSYVIDQLRSQRESGLRVSIDDFGTGYSSLSYLQVFPLDELKIDRSFIKNLSLNERNRTLVQAMITMGHALGMKVVAEGVENQSELDFLLESGCDTAQGYLLSRPLSADQLEIWLENHLELVD